MKKLRVWMMILLVLMALQSCIVVRADGIQSGVTPDGWRYSLEFGKLFITGYAGNVPANWSERLRRLPTGTADGRKEFVISVDPYSWKRYLVQ